MNNKKYFVVQVGGGYYVTTRPMQDEKIVFSGTFFACRRFIDPSY